MSENQTFAEEMIDAMCEDAIGLNRRWTRIHSDQLRHLAHNGLENARLRSELDWTTQELLEVMRIVGPPDGTDGDITRLMKLTAIRRMVEADDERYLALAQRREGESNAT